jgi:hypothetical protein
MRIRSCVRRDQVIAAGVDFGKEGGLRSSGSLPRAAVPANALPFLRNGMTGGM